MVPILSHHQKVYLIEARYVLLPSITVTIPVKILMLFWVWILLLLCKARFFQALNSFCCSVTCLYCTISSFFVCPFYIGQSNSAQLKTIRNNSRLLETIQVNSKQFKTILILWPTFSNIWGSLKRKFTSFKKVKQLEIILINGWIWIFNVNLRKIIRILPKMSSLWNKSSSRTLRGFS